MFIVHPLIRPGTLDEREYQRDLAGSCLRSSTLVVLPTGTGKTVVALRAIAEVLHLQGGRALLLAPTKPLVEQHASFLRRCLIGKNVVMLTGEITPPRRAECWERGDVVVSTPQAVANDLRSGLVTLDDVRLIVFDEAHRGVGSYAYVAVAEEHRRLGGLRMGITASPGSTRGRIEKVCTNLGLAKIEVVREDDEVMRGYIHDITTEWTELEVPDELDEVISSLRSLHDTCIEQLKKMRLVSGKRPPTTMYLLEIGQSIRSRMGKGKKSGYLFRALSVQAMAIKTSHALMLAETQGKGALISYMEKLKAEAGSKGASKATQRIVKSPQFQEVEEALQATGSEHPKMAALVEAVTAQLRTDPGSKMIVFTNFRDSCEAVARRLATVEGVKVSKLIGQANRPGDQGFRQAEQVEALSRLRRGEVNTIVATCVGEEGLDVANTDLVVFCEPVPSEIRSIQRRGRTGRSRPGRVVVLVTKGTRDEVSLSTSLRKERAMNRHLANLQREKAEEAEA